MKILKNKVLIGICTFAYHHQLSHIKIWWCIEYSLSWNKRQERQQKGVNWKLINHLHTIKNYGVHMCVQPQQLLKTILAYALKSITWHERTVFKNCPKNVSFCRSKMRKIMGILKGQDFLDETFWGWFLETVNTWISLYIPDRPTVDK